MPQMMLRRVLGTSAVAAGLAVFALNIAGLLLPIAEHPKARATSVHKTDLVRPPYHAALNALHQIDRGLPAEQRLAKANEIVAARVVHYWPEPQETDVHVMYSPLENWYLAAIQRIEAGLAKYGLAEVDFARRGRRDYRSILAKGVGLCGMKALALADFFREQGQELRILALGGHVVAYASVDGRNYILDPDHNVFIADVPAPPARSMEKFRAAYVDAGYSGRKLQKLERKYAQSSMKLLEIENFQGSWKRWTNGGRIIKWLVPAVLVLLGGMLLWRGSKQSSNLGLAPSTRTNGRLSIDVRDELIIVTRPGTSFLASYRRESHFPGLMLGTEIIDPGADLDAIRQFVADAFGAAMRQARELGWIV